MSRHDVKWAHNLAHKNVQNMQLNQWMHYMQNISCTVQEMLVERREARLRRLQESLGNLAAAGAARSGGERRALRRVDAMVAIESFRVP